MTAATSQAEFAAKFPEGSLWLWLRLTTMELAPGRPPGTRRRRRTRRCGPTRMRLGPAPAAGSFGAA
jgi:hypothetical protein